MVRLFGNNGHDSDRVSARDRLERDEQGTLRGRKERDREQGFNNRQSPRGRFSGGNGGGGDNGWKKFIFSMAILVILVIIGMGSTGGFKNLLRTFNATPTEHLNNYFTSAKKLENDNKRDGAEYTIYDKNNLFDDTGITQKIDKEYLVYIYTKDEKKDKPFNSWIEKNEFEIPIYRLDIRNIETNTELLKYAKENKPMMLLYNEIERGKKELDGVIKDPDLLKEIIPRVDKIIEEKTGEGANKDE